MIKNNKFYIPRLKNVILVGYSAYYDQIEKINKKLNLNTIKISTPSYKKNFKLKDKVNFFKKIDKKFILFLKKITNYKDTIFFSFGSRWIFKKNQIDKIFYNNIINYHGSRLPLDAGGGGFSWRIMRGDRLGANLAHLVSDKIDSGPIIQYEEYIFPHYCQKPTEYEEFYRLKFIPFYKKLITNLKNKKRFKLVYSNQSLGRYNPRLKTKINGWIDWNWKSNDIFNFINAFDDPYDGASTTVNNKYKVFIKKVHLHRGEISSHPFSRGIVIRKNKNWLVVSLGDENNLLVEIVLDSKKKNILNKIKLGDRFFTDKKYLQKSLSFRPTYK